MPVLEKEQWLFLGIVAFFTLYAWRSLFASIRASSWPSVSGEIINAEMEYDHRGSDDGKWRLHCTYKFHIGREKYVSQKIGFGTMMLSGFLLTLSTYRSVTRFKPRVQVRYQKSNPKNSVLLVGPQLYLLANVVISTGILGMLIKEFTQVG